MSDLLPAAADAPAPPPGRWARLLEGLHRHRYALALLSFAIGMASFLLIERRERLAQWLAGLLILAWLLILFEKAAARRLRLPPGLVRYGIQAVQQETFFFVLPFLLHTTAWTTGQGAFTGIVIFAGLCSMWDPLYYGVILPRRWLSLGFHAFAVFTGMLVLAPIVIHLTSRQTLGVAAAAAGLFALPGLAQMLDPRRVLHWLGLGVAGGAIGALALYARPWIPPATLWVPEAFVTSQLNEAARAPGSPMTVVAAARIHEGLYAWTPIKAPRGLRERVYHRWLRDGREIDRIPIEIVGGRDQGYRAWSHKRGFPAQPAGRWTVQVLTDGGQLIGQVSFTVTP